MGEIYDSLISILVHYVFVICIFSTFYWLEETRKDPLKNVFKTLSTIFISHTALY